MNSLTARRIGIVVGLAILVGSFAVARYFSQLKQAPPRREVAQSVPSVETITAQNKTIPTQLDIQGQLVAYDKIEIFSEVAGTLVKTDRPFKVGTYFPQGSLLAEIDDQEARLSLLSQKANLLNAITQLMPDLKVDYPQSFEQWRTYLDSFAIEKELQPLPEPLNQQEKYFIASRNLYSQFYTIKSAEERLSKYKIYAPFSGVLTDAAINPGALIRVGQKLGELMNTSHYELQATIPLSELKYIQVGNQVNLTSRDITGSWNGRIRRISDRIDPTTQTVQVFVDVRGRDLKEGMYLSGDVKASDIDNAVELPRDLLIDQTRVYTVQDSFLRLREVEVVKLTRQSAIVRGLPDSTPLLKTALPNAFDGMKVKAPGVDKKEAASTPIDQTVGSL